jgi:hypothetical protein
MKRRNLLLFVLGTLLSSPGFAQNLIKNGDFAVVPGWNWNINILEGTGSITGGEAVINITNVRGQGNGDSQIELQYNEAVAGTLMVEANKTYVYSFDAWATVFPFELETHLGQPSGAYPTYLPNPYGWGVGEVRLTDVNTRYEFVFTVGATPFPDMRLHFQLGDDDGVTQPKASIVHIDNVSLVKKTIQISDQNINEALTAASFVARLSELDLTGNVAYSLAASGDTTDDGNASFFIRNDSLLSAEVFNYNVKTSYNIFVESTNDGGVTKNQKPYVITINNIDENSAPITSLSLDNSSIGENKPVGEVVGTLSCEDADGLANTYTYTLILGDGTNDAGNSKFTTKGDKLVAAQTLNFEEQSSYSVYVQADDGNNNTFNKAFTITLINQANNINLISNGTFDATTEGWTNNTTGNGTLNWLAGELEYVITTVGTNTYSVEIYYYNISFVKGKQYTFSFDAYGLIDHSIIPIAGENQGSWTTWLSSTPTLITKTKSNYTYTFTAAGTYDKYRIGFQLGKISTNALNTLYFDNFSLIMNGEENTPPAGLALSKTSVDEKVAIGTPVGTLNAVDPDAGDTLTYSIYGGIDQSYFALNADGVTLETAAEIDFALIQNLDVWVKVKDLAGDSATAILQIAVNEVIIPNSVPTLLSLSSQTLPEDAGLSTVVGLLSTVDADVADTHTYQFVAGTGDTDNSLFLIDGNSLILNTALDFETKTSYSVLIETNDQRGGLLSTSFEIAVTNVNEAPYALQLSNSTIDEELPAGTMVGLFSALDVDAGTVLNYELIGGDGINDMDNDKFYIVKDTLFTNAKLDYETQTTYNIFAGATDGGLYGMNPFVITLNNINENVSVSHIQAGFQQVYPNPFTSSVFVKGWNSENLNVSVFNLEGCLVYSSETNGSPVLEINPGNLQSGVYILKISSVSRITQTILIRK